MKEENRMKCAVFHGRNDVRVEERPIPKVRPGEVLLKVAFAGICGSELHALFKEGKPTSNMYVPGRILGHEYSGIVAEVGEGVDSFQVGDRVVGTPGMRCGKCPACKSGDNEFCTDIIRPEGGAWAEYTAVREEMIHHLPDKIPLEFGAMTEPVASTLNSTLTAGIQLGHTVLITGAGCAGSLLLQFARRAGASLVIVSEPFALKRDLATRLGADIVVDPTAENLLEVVREATEERGVHIALEASGFPQATVQCLAAAASGGTIVQHGVVPSTIEIPFKPWDLYARLLTVKGTIGLRIKRAISMLDKLELEPLITVFDLADIHAGIDFLKAGKGIKVLLKP
jgi:(R,R)-butanediol dehydrogenase/meso-butanediol dehydrogenase/diacetyl reductase